MSDYTEGGKLSEAAGFTGIDSRPDLFCLVQLEHSFDANINLAMVNPRVYMDLSVEDEPLGRYVSRAIRSLCCQRRVYLTLGRAVWSSSCSATLYRRQ